MHYPEIARQINDRLSVFPSHSPSFPRTTPTKQFLLCQGRPQVISQRLWDGVCMIVCASERERERHVYVYSSCLQRPFLDKGYDSIHVRKQEGKNNRLCRCSVWPKLITLSHAHTRHICHYNQTQAKPIHSHVNQYKMGEQETKYLRYQMYYDGFIFIPFWWKLYN
jgi:hypothetical protein